MSFKHDVFRQGTTNNVSFNTSTGAAVQSAAFGSQTYAIRIALQGAITATAGVRYSVAENSSATSNSSLLPVQWVEYVKVTPGQKISVLSNDSVTGMLSIVELTD